MNQNNVRKPNFFIVGAPKCGTTSLYNYLRQHPDIFMPNHAKEPHYFTTDFPNIKFKGDMNDYLGLFQGATHEKKVGEATTWYLYSKDAAENIKKFSGSDTKIIIMLRNPADMLYSLHGQWLFSGNEDVRDFNHALKLEQERKQGKSIPQYCYFRQGLYYHEVANYCEQVERYYSTFGKENVHVICFDDFSKDVESEYACVLRFLGVDDSFSPEFAISNSKKLARMLYLQHVMRNPPSFITSFGKMIFSKKQRMGIRSLIKKMNSVKSTRKPLDRGVRNKINEEFKEVIDGVYKHTGIESIKEWNHDA